MAVRADWQQVIGRVYVVRLLDRRQRHQMMYLDVVLGSRAIHLSKLEATHPAVQTVVLNSGLSSFVIAFVFL